MTRGCDRWGYDESCAIGCGGDGRCFCDVNSGESDYERNVSMTAMTICICANRCHAVYDQALQVHFRCVCLTHAHAQNVFVSDRWNTEMLRVFSH